MRFNFGCATSASAPIITGVNTLLLSASTTPAPDIVALAASDGGIVNIPGTTGTGVFAVATINLGAGDTITASADTGASRCRSASPSARRMRRAPAWSHPARP